MNKLRRAYRGEQDVDFPTWSKRTLVVSMVLMVISIALLAFNGLNLGLDFEGGSSWSVPSQDFERADAEAVLADFPDATGAEFQEATTTDGQRILRISGQVEDVNEGSAVADALAEAAGLEPGDVAVTTIGPSWGADITRQAVQSLIWFVILITVYLAWRLEARMAFAALVSVIHDLILTLGFYALLQIEVSPATVIAFLTILGYSLYDTVVIFDRLQDGERRHSKSGNYTFSMIERRTLNQSLMRCVNTSITTILPILSMWLVGGYLFDQPLLADFSLALVIGLGLGVYSSLYVASPIFLILKERDQRYVEIRTRLEQRGVDVSDTRWPESRPTVAAAASSASTVGAPAVERSGDAPPLSVNIGGHPPRPRKSRPKR